MTILAALIEYDVDGTTKYLGVTDKQYKDTTGVSLEDGLWYPALSSDVNWSESARHPYQEQGGELVVGDLVIANDGTFDWLIDADIVGMKVTLKRGDPDESFGSMEQIFIARIAGRRFEGHSVIIELDNWLAKLSGPVFTETFGSDTPNPQLVGKQIPYVLGKVTQAPVLEYDPNNLTYYTAENVSLIGEVTEGGNPTQKWYLNEQPTFDLKGSPTLPITATFEGPSDTGWTTIIDDDLNTWASGSDTALTAPYTNQGDKPSGWTLIIGDNGLSTTTAVQDGGLKITTTGDSASGELDVVGTGINDSDAQTDRIDSSYVVWTNPDSAVSSDSGSATITTGSGKTDALSSQSDSFQSASQFIGINHSVVSGSPVLEYIEILKDGEVQYSESLNEPLSGGTFFLYLNSIWGEVDGRTLGNQARARIKLSDDDASECSVDYIFISGRYAASPSAHLRKDVGFTTGLPYSIEIDCESTDGSALLWGSASTLVDWPEHADFHEFTKSDSDEIVDGTVTLKSIIEPTGSVFNLSNEVLYSTRGRDTTRIGTVKITGIRIKEQSAGNKSYKSLAPHVIETAGYTSSEYDQTSFNTHADEYGDPELGWLVTKNESADQVLFRLAGSLFGYVWHGLDGKVRSKKLEAPGPVSDPFTITSANCDPAQIIAYDDEAPNLRKSVNALRNWQPLDTDDTAGVTTTWTESDRAAVTTDWRITRAWEMGADGKDEFTRRWPMVASREPFATALRDATTTQLVANQGPDQWIERPMFYEVSVYVPVGELSKVAVGETVKAELDYPGLEDDWLLVLGRSGGAMEGMVNLTLWSAGTVPVTLLHGDSGRVDPRIEFTRNSVAHRWTENKVLEEVAANTIRRSYNFDTAQMEYLFEDSLTNAITAPEDFSNAAWGKFNVTITANNKESPLGGATADKITETSASGLHQTDHSEIAISANTKYTFSLFISRDFVGTRNFGLSPFNRSGAGGSGANYAIFDQNGDFVAEDGTGASLTYKVKKAATYFRVEVTGVTGSSPTTGAFPTLRLFDGTTGSYTGDGTSGLYAWGAQFEQGAASSYTDGTRAADDALIDGQPFADMWNDSEGTFVVDVSTNSPSSAAESVLTVSDGTTNELIDIRFTGGADIRSRVRSGAASGFEAVHSLATSARVAFGFESGSQASSANGGTVKTGTTTDISEGLTQLWIGSLNSAGDLNGHIAHLWYYPKRLTNEQLQAASVVGRDLILDKV